GGNDVLRGGDSSVNNMPGKAPPLPTGAVNNMFGEADVMSGSAQGGDDRLIGGNHADNYLIGDANSGLSGNARGGNDTLIGGDDSSNNLFGDAGLLSDNARGGD